MQDLQESLPRTIVEYITQPVLVDGVEDNFCHILKCVLWAFKPCIDGFNYCKPIVQVDGTFLTGKYHGTLLTTISQDGNRNIFPLAFTIVEGEKRRSWYGSLSYCVHMSHSNQMSVSLLTEAQPYYQHYNLQMLVGKHMGCNQCFASGTLHQTSIRSLKMRSLKDN